MGKLSAAELVQGSHENIRRSNDLKDAIDPQIFDSFRCTGFPERQPRPGFAVVDTTGFKQNADGHEIEDFNPYTIGRLPRSNRTNDTVENRVQEHVLWGLSPKEKDAYVAEEKAIEEYNRDFINWATRRQFGSSEPPKAPDVPMHQEVKKRVEDLKQKVTDEVRSQMSPEQLKDLDRAMKQYNRDYREALDKRSLVLIIHPSLPKPPAAVQDYYRRIRETVNKL